MEQLLNEIDLSEEEIDKGLKSKNMSKNEFLKTIDKTIEKYAEKGTETLARVLGKKM